jgi:hypothetical protein
MKRGTFTTDVRTCVISGRDCYTRVRGTISIYQIRNTISARVDSLPYVTNGMHVMFNGNSGVISSEDQGRLKLITQQPLSSMNI